MGQVAIVSPQIIDSTSIGRDLITAANAAAARGVLELEDSSYNWAGDHVFEAGIEATAYNFTPGVDGQLNHPDLASSIYVRFNNSDVYRFNALDFWPVANGTKNLGRSDHRWANVYSVNGDFSGTVQTEYITGVNGTTTDGSIWMRPTLGHVFIRGAGGANVARFANSSVLLYADLAPQTGGIYSLGLTNQRWSNTYSVDGSFSGNLNVESGGSIKVYNLGSEGDADTEFIETSFTANVATISAKATGSGVVRDLNFSGHDGDFSGDVVMAANVDFTGLPTADPLVAGRLWNDGGTMKISAG